MSLLFLPLFSLPSSHVSFTSSLWFPSRFRACIFLTSGVFKRHFGSEIMLVLLRLMYAATVKREVTLFIYMS
jgi:hypothetical protein